MKFKMIAEHLKQLTESDVWFNVDKKYEDQLVAHMENAINTIFRDKDYKKGLDELTQTTQLLRTIVSMGRLKEDITHSAQEFTSANTSINSSKLPAVFNLVQFTPDTINLDYGGGKFDNAAEFLATKNVINLVYDPFNRSSSHNEDVLAKIKEHNGADSATLSNVLNVIKEESIREEVLNNIKQLIKPGAELYITVYEGDKSEEGRETKAGYQLNRKTSSYLDEIIKIFGEGNVKQKGKLIIAKN